RRRPSEHADHPTRTGSRTARRGTGRGGAERTGRDPRYPAVGPRGGPSGDPTDRKRTPGGDTAGHPAVTLTGPRPRPRAAAKEPVRIDVSAQFTFAVSPARAVAFRIRWRTGAPARRLPEAKNRVTENHRDPLETR